MSDSDKDGEADRQFDPDLPERTERFRLVETLNPAALSGRGQDEDKRRTMEAGFDDHLVKPAEPATLQALLGNLDQHPPSHLCRDPRLPRFFRTRGQGKELGIATISRE